VQGVEAETVNQAGEENRLREIAEESVDWVGIGGGNGEVLKGYIAEGSGFLTFASEDEGEGVISLVIDCK